MKMVEFAMTVGITAAISVPVTYHITNMNGGAGLCQTVSDRNPGDTPSPAPVQAEPAPEQEWVNSIAKNAPPGPGPLDKDNELPTLPEPHNSGTETSKHENVEISYAEFAKQQQEIEQIRKFSESHDPASYNQILQNKYDAEEIDYSWAANREAELLNLFGTEKGLDYAVPTSLSCKSSNCQVKVPVSGQQQASLIYRAFLEAVIKNSGDSERPIISYFPEPDGNELILYVSRNGSSRLFE
jgi:hypothetical protein